MITKFKAGDKIRFKTWDKKDWFLIDSIDNDGGAFGTVYNSHLKKYFFNNGYYIADEGWTFYNNFNEELEAL